MTELRYSDEIVLRATGWPTKDLSCPRCSSPYLHQTDVRVYDRREDARQETVITVADGSAKVEIVDAAVSGNPSGRRHGLAIRFNCEGCCNPEDEDIIELTFAQHKGNTLVGWRYTPMR